MKIKLSYTFLILIHAILALIVFVLPFLAKIYALLIPIVGFFIVYQTKNKNNEVLLVSAYLIGIEVFLRMTNGNLNNEYVKFCTIFFMFYGMIYSSFSKNAFIYWFFLFLLIPGILVTASSEYFDIDVRKVLVFNLSGPVCLAICAIYMFERKISSDNLQSVMVALGLPIVTTTVYLFLYNPSVHDVVTGTQSNFETSGGFGPNQVSTILGLGMFVFFTQLILYSKSRAMLLINGFLVIFITYRAIVTFSRGGVITGAFMIVSFLMLMYFYAGARNKAKLGFVMIITFLMSLGIWTYSSLQTSGLINKRYANQDAMGRTKKDRLGGREEIIDAEFKLFLDSPVFGVGAGLGKKVRNENFGMQIASHNEITRMLAEHGLFGIFGLLILFITPFILYFNNRQNLYFLSFFGFWLLTINHAAMRIAAPAFVYALSLLSVRITTPEKAEN
ncbi:O-antigen ligase family protein [Flavobacterium daemonense]|uniref:O-antigen ligase family protein n=1 Tax=Flavobacterium daemonense TaxID=1393049 RepID=UPI001184AE06|nr:O-antigen ligase family protein [Flavobacterium daemonense]KAF2333100.1 O-antigen ligase family protein [Flavobacterium daemonense]